VSDLDWGWWQHSTADADALRRIVADWLEQGGHDDWAAWFRDGVGDRDRVDRFFGPPDRRFLTGPFRGLSHRVLMGPMPVATPTTRFDGPWFSVLHVLLEDVANRPPVSAVAALPCTARVSDLVVHTQAITQGEQLGSVRLHLDALGPLAARLRGVWALTDHVVPGALHRFRRLERLGAPLGPGTWRHPQVTTLHTSVAGECGTVDLPRLQRLDLEDGGGDVRGLLAQVPSVEDLEIDAPVGEEVARAHSDGLLPRLQTLRVWGEPPALPGVRIERLAPWPRTSIRRTSDWVIDRAIRIAHDPESHV
jgi:hypothetical protein